ncbi:MAG: triacylglycerol lipase [Actinomycetales bacterium]|nr:MAG: triacylglycerol lipase [Actinomycetales bacterium]
MARRARPTILASAVLMLVGLLTGLAPQAASAATSPLDDPFYTYSGSTPLQDVAAGTVLKTRTVPYSIQGLPLPIKAVQVLYRTRNQRGEAVVNATTVVRPLLSLSLRPKVLSYQSFYDSLNPEDQPSAAIAGGQGLGKAIANIETLVFAPALLAGYTINIPDTEGQTADFAAGPEYGYTTLDSLRAISQSPAAGVGTTSKIGLMGYSGGAIGSEWAAELAASYAPAVSKRIVGTAIGGVLVHPGHNLHYVEGSTVWAGVLPMALVGISRGFGIDLSVYANDYGKSILTKLQKASIAEVLGAYPGLTWAKIAKPEFKTPESVKAYVDVANQLIMSTGGTPSAPMFIGQGTGGYLEGTQPSATYGAGDGVMIAGDVRSLARTYCSRGVTVKYDEYLLSHFTSVAQWLPSAYAWLTARFAGLPAPSSCGKIAPGNSLEPIKLVP